MYDLGEQFKFDLNKAISNSECIFKGKKYRITVLTERLLRLEYNETGNFNDYPTHLVWYRNLPKPEFSVSDSNSELRIRTRYFELFYKKEKNFWGGKFNPMSNLKINLLNTNKIWYYKHPEARNYEIITNLDNSKKIVNGLYSLDGFVSIDDSNTPIILENGVSKLRENGGIDLYVFLYNKDYYFCLNDYFSITGNPPLIPRYALGNWWCKSDAYNESNIASIVNKFHDKKIPISVFMFDRWQTNDGYEFNEFYKNPQSIASYLLSKKINMGLVIDDILEFKGNSKNFEKLKPYLQVDKNGNIPFNLFDEKVIDAYLKILIKPLNDIGVKLFFLNSFNKNNEQRNFLLKYYLFYNKLGSNRALISSYNSNVAPHRYPVLYSGKTKVSWSTLKDVIKYNIQSSNMGISFTSCDLGGTGDGIEDSELFIRFVQLGTFSSILRLGSEVGKYYKREPWKWDLATYIIIRKFLNLRYSLIPYIYTEAYKYHRYGKPLIEPLYYRYPALYDDDLYSNEYFFGSNILVSPIISKKDYIMNRVIHKMYIPEGIWYDMFTGKKYTGNKRYISFYTDEQYPVFVKAGTILVKSLNEYNDTSNPKQMEIEVFPGNSNTYSIYEDDGITNNFQNGDYLITNVEYIYKKDSYVLTILPVNGKQGTVPQSRDYKIRFRNTSIASKVSSYVGNEQIANKYYSEASDLIIEINNVPTNTQFTIICNGKNIEFDAMYIINEDIVSIISDLPINTNAKQKIDSIMFSNELTLQKKRIEIRKLTHGKDRIEEKYVDLFLKLLEYIKEV